MGVSAEEKIMQERRNERRLLCAELVEVAWQDDAGRKQRRIANLEDISPRGICLQMERPLPEGTEVTARHSEGELSGIVRYCGFREFGYFLGIEFPEEYRWSPRLYRPEHLLDLKELVEQAMHKRQEERRAAAALKLTA